MPPTPKGQTLNLADKLAAVPGPWQPHVVAERVWFRAVRKPHDPVLQSVYQHDREVRGDVQQWLATAARAHPVHALV